MCSRAGDQQVGGSVLQGVWGDKDQIVVGSGGNRYAGFRGVAERREPEGHPVRSSAQRAVQVIAPWRSPESLRHSGPHREVPGLDGWLDGSPTRGAGVPRASSSRVCVMISPGSDAADCVLASGGSRSTQSARLLDFVTVRNLLALSVNAVGSLSDWAISGLGKHPRVWGASDARGFEPVDSSAGTKWTAVHCNLGRDCAIRIAVTGHHGFIGSHVARRLESLGHQVVRVEGDVREVALPVADGFLHFAAKMGGIGYFSTHQFEPILENLAMDVRVIQHCHDHGIRLLYPSSACAYPVSAMEAGIALSEDLLSGPADPDQMYGIQKWCVTRLSEHADFDFRVAILHTIYGEDQEYTGNRAKFPPQICYKFATADKVWVWGDGTQTRTFLHVDDATEMLLEIFFAKSYHGPVNVSHPMEVSVREVVDVLSVHTGRKDIEFDPTKPTGPMRRPVDNTKYYAHYSWRPKVDVAEGFTRLYDHIANQAGVKKGGRCNEAAPMGVGEPGSRPR